MRIVNVMFIQKALLKYKDRLTQDQIIHLLLSRNVRIFNKRLRIILHGTRTTKPSRRRRRGI